MSTGISSATTVDEAVAALERDGVVRLPGFLSAEQLALAQRDLFALMDHVPNGTDATFLGTRTRRASGLFGRTRALDSAATHPLFLETATRLLATPTTMWSGNEQVKVTPSLQIGATQCIQIRPGQGLQPLHRDDFVFHNPHPGPDLQLAMMIALSDFTAENGATRVVPGSHRWDDDRCPAAEETVPAEMTAGSALLWLGSTFHGGGQNITDDSFRTGVALSYIKGYLRQEENHYLALRRDEIAACPARIQEMLGYAVSEPFMGWIVRDGEAFPPSVVLTDAALEMAVSAD